MSLIERLVAAQPTDARRRWLRQAAGVFRATRQVNFRPPAPTRAAVTWLVIQSSLVFLLVLPLQLAGPTVPVEAAVGSAIVAGLLLLIGHVAILVGAEADAVREVEQKSLDTLVASPLQGSSYLVGKAAFWQWAQLFQFACHLPLLALCHALGVVGLVDVLAAAAVLQASTFVFTTLLIARVQRRQVQRRKGSRFVLTGGGRAAGGVAVGMMIGLLVALGMGAAASQAGGAAASVFVALLGVIPSVALTSTVMPTLAHPAGGLPVPAWAWGLALTACIAPLIHADARRRWKPPPTSTGADLRVGMLMLVAALAAVAVSATRTNASAAWLMVAAVQAVLIALPGWAATSAFCDVGRGQRRGPFGLFAMRRDTSGEYVGAAAAIVLVIVAALAPSTLAERWILVPALLVAAIPLVVLGTAIGRGFPPSRAMGLLVTVALAAFWLGFYLLPSLGEIVATVLGLGGEVSRPLEDVLELAASASPVNTFAGIATDLGGTVRASDTYWPLGLALQSGLAAAAWLWARRRRARGQDLPRKSSARRSVSP